MTYRNGWKGVTWPRIVRGKCSKHGTSVGPFTRMCIDCHKEQMQKARDEAPRAGLMVDDVMKGHK